MKKIEINFKEYLTEIYDKPKKIHESFKIFHKYSLNNSIMAIIQLGRAEPINTYQGWIKLGRQVKKGSRAIELFLPVKYKIEIEDKENYEKDFFKTVFIKKKYWFGLSQTEGEEFKQEIIPDFDINQTLKNLQIEQIEFSNIDGNSQGYAIPNQKKVAVNPLSYSPFGTLIHEIAHCILHDKDNKIIDGKLLDISTKEFEAETTAYLVCSSLGKFENLEYSRGYIGDWIKRDEVQEINFKRAFDCANKILQAGLIKNNEE